MWQFSHALHAHVHTGMATRQAAQHTHTHTRIVKEEFHAVGKEEHDFLQVVDQFFYFGGFSKRK